MIPKEKTFRSAAFRAFVRSHACAACSWPPELGPPGKCECGREYVYVEEEEAGECDACTAVAV